uniref:Uncharacterized protein n=1 Tax=Pavo cristatus TaxID=9049 RepID=A0A8C9FYN9_PAVCR
MERSEGGEQSRQQQQPWGRLTRLGAEEAEPHVLLLKREWTIGRKKGGTGCVVEINLYRYVGLLHCIYISHRWTMFLLICQQNV